MAVPGAPVKDRFTALDALALTREVRQLVGGRLDKAFTGRPGGVDLQFRVPQRGRHELHIVSGRFAFLRESSGDHAEELDPLAKELRRLLSGARLAEVSDAEGERYLELVFRRPDVDGPLILGAELFGAGNVVVARAGTIAAVEHTRRWAHRTVRIGAEYQRPPSRINALAASAAVLEGLLSDSRTDRASTLAARLGLGGPLAEELLARAGVAGNVAAPSDAAEVAPRLALALGQLVQEVGDTPRGFLYLSGETPLDVAPAPLTRWRGAPGVEMTQHPSFSAAAEAYFGSLPALVVEPPTPSDEARAELLRQRDQQLKAVEGLKETVLGLQQRADLILRHYPEAEAALTAGPEGVAEGSVEVELEGRSVPLLRGRPVRDSARALYDEAKRLKSKLSGAEAALIQTQEKLRLAEGLRPASATGTRPPGDLPSPRRKTHWFERYRWFFSSEGILVIGGRDAQSNDLIVRRYLNPGDVYVHADIHGAPSVIVKHPAPGSPPPTEPTLREAGQWGFAFSKAWRAGLASGAAFWVTPDQVSKAGSSGEFVPRGAWVIHGTKNYLRDLPAELALGTLPLEGEVLWTVAPPSALAARGEIRVLLSPGEERERPVVEVELSRDLAVPRGLLQSLLPAGGIAARRV
ncbi:MAG TPA: ribosome rescue protein RqcH [Thermoplasmata archaeon]|nr:ribosome rescue protein RqcH [Thermoplasmata archaeon]